MAAKSAHQTLQGSPARAIACPSPGSPAASLARTASAGRLRTARCAAAWLAGSYSAMIWLILLSSHSCSPPAPPAPPAPKPPPPMTGMPSGAGLQETAGAGKAAGGPSNWRCCRTSRGQNGAAVPLQGSTEAGRQAGRQAGLLHVAGSAAARVQEASAHHSFKHPLHEGVGRPARAASHAGDAN